MFNLFKKKFNIDKILKAHDKRMKYDTITSDLIDELSDDALLQAIYDYVQQKVIFGSSQNTYSQYCNLPVGIQDLFAIYYFELAEESDGLNCYFDYDYGLFAEELIRAFSSINALTSREVVIKCIYTEFGTMEKFKQIRNQYYEYAKSREQNEALVDLEKDYIYHIDYTDKTLIEYIRKNREVFITH
jgi:hypothetical protein